MKAKREKKETPHKQPRSKRNIIIILILLIAIAIGYKSFNDPDIENVVTENQSDSQIKGKALASRYCQSCHLAPDPALLDKPNWEAVLPVMGLKLGIRSHKGVFYQATDPRSAAEESKLIPAQAAMDEGQWQSVIDYFVSAAPAKLRPQNRSVMTNSLTSFAVINAPEFMSRRNLMISYVKIDNSVKPARLFVFETYSKQLFLLNNKLRVLDSVKTDGIIVDINFQNGQILAVSMGNKLNMSDKEKIGKVFPLVVSQSGKIQVKPEIFKSLALPVQIIPADLNADGRIDYVVCEFGFLTGSLTWMENRGGGKFERHAIRNFPGSVNAYIRDNNGKPDLWVLFAQGEEGVFHFKNDGHGKFEARQVLRFPSVYGSTSFQMVDMNNDGFEDIIYTCGDNGDYTRILKPYHGVYIYINDGENNFTQNYFYPINGCYKVIAKDFMKTGRKDLAVIAFFPDAMQPEESFVYLKNEGNLNFSPLILPQGANFERVLTMDSGDIDGDGKTDLLLGNTYPFPGQKGDGRKESFFRVLKNLGKQ